MPYKERDPFHRCMREYLKDVGETGSALTVSQYRYNLEQIGNILGFPDPKTISLKVLRGIEQEVQWAETSTAIRLSIFRAFLRHAGNPEALRWKIISKQRPKMNGVFLGEESVGIVRQCANGLSVEHELIYSLGVDNGLRCIDMQRLTMENANQLLSSGMSMIKGKGRNGGKSALLVMNQATFEPLIRYLAHRRQMVEAKGQDLKELLIKPAADGELRPYYYGWIYLAVEEISKAAGIDFQPHDLRRTFGNRHWKKGTPIETIAKLMRHDSVNQTFRCYIGVTCDDMLAAQRNLCPFVPIQYAGQR